MIHELQQQMMRMWRAVDQLVPARCMLPTGISLPLASIEAVQEAERLLLDESVKHQVVSYLNQASDKTPEEVSRCVLQKIMTASVAKQMTFRGRSGKLSFNTLQLNTVVHEAICQKLHGRGASEISLDAVIATWLVNARDRDGRKKQRTRQLGEEHQPNSAAAADVDEEDFA